METGKITLKTENWNNMIDEEFEKTGINDKQVLEMVESVLADIHPRAFALIRETAKRFTAGSCG